MKASDNTRQEKVLRQPLSGIRVLDIATFQAAPLAATILGEFGAEVIKIEQPDGGDPLRHYGTLDPCGDSYLWLSEARNKKSITLNLRELEGVALFKKMVAKADIVTENFRPGTLEKWGLGYETLRAINPGIVMLRISAYGQTGPNKDLPGFARIAHAFSGVSYLTGDPDRPPASPGIAGLGDYLSGVYGALGVMMALRAREVNDGIGQFVDIGLYEPIFRMMDELAPAYAKTGQVRERMGADIAIACPHSHYPTKDGKWVAIACSSDKMFERLVAAMDKPEMAADRRYAKAHARIEHRDFMNEFVSTWTSAQTQSQVLAVCEAFDVPCGPVHSIADIFNDPQYAARENLLQLVNTRAGDVVLPGILPALSETPGRFSHVGPALGEHNAAVYAELLDLSMTELDTLREKGVI